MAIALGLGFTSLGFKNAIDQRNRAIIAEEAAQGEASNGDDRAADMNQFQQREQAHSTVTDLARLRGLSTSVPFCTAT